MSCTEDLYHLGLPGWAFAGWKNRYFTFEPSPLASYATVFNAVEGNTAFYRVPDRKTVEKWRAALAGSQLRICFKLPRTVTHQRKPSLNDLQVFRSAIAPLVEHIGPLLVQFPASLAPEDIPVVEPLIETLAADFSCAVEVRHPQFFAEPERLTPLLERYGCGRVVLDTRALYEGDRNHPEVVAALHEKPDLPVLGETHNNLAFVRLVLHPDRLHNAHYINQWAARVAGYLSRGIASYVMIHCPNNLHCPELALEFHDALLAQRDSAGLTPLPAWSVPLQGQLI